MKRPAFLCALGMSALAAVALAQDPSSTQSTTTTTQVSPDGVTTKTTTINGKVVRYEAGKTIVLVGPDNRETTYMLTDRVQAPTDVPVGRQVSLSTEPSNNGQVLVTRITTTSITPEGNLKTETQTQSMSPSGEQPQTAIETKTTTITGTVSAFEPGKSVTFVLPDKKTVVYSIDASSVVPSDVAVGSTYTVETTTSTSGGVVVKKITTTKTTKKSTTVQP